MEAQSDRPVMRVVAAVIWRDDRVYAAQRGYGDMKDGWEFPGGKIEPGETPEQACRREIREELAVDLSTMWYLDTVEYDYPDFHLSMDCFVATLKPGQEPEFLEHESARWVGQDELLDVGWLPADKGLVESLGGLWDQIFSAEHL